MRTLFISPSYLCNESCVFCPCHKIARRYTPVPIDLILSSIDDAMLRNNIEMVLISGGEPLLYKDLPKVINYAKQCGLKIGILSNSLKFADENFTQDFIEIVGNDFELTTAFHSCISDEHDSITNIKGSFEKSLRGVHSLIKSGVKVTIKYVINGLSYMYLPLFVEWVYATFPDTVSFVICNIDLCGEALENSEMTAVPFKESKQYLEKALDIVIKYSENGRHRHVSVFNTPLCTIDPYYWKFLRKYESEETMDALLLPSADSASPSFVRYDLKGDGGANFAPCAECCVQEICPGTWRQTAEYFGDSMFNPFN